MRKAVNEEVGKQGRWQRRPSYPYISSIAEQVQSGSGPSRGAPFFRRGIQPIIEAVFGTGSNRQFLIEETRHWVHDKGRLEG